MGRCRGIKKGGVGLTTSPVDASTKLFSIYNLFNSHLQLIHYLRYLPQNDHLKLACEF